MYLSLLNAKQKKLFLSLAFNLSNSDGNFSDAEKDVVESYFKEMNIRIELNEVDTDMQRVMEEINVFCEPKEKRIIVFELIGLAMADLKYDEAERTIISEAIEIFNMKPDFKDFCERKLFEYLKIQEEINEAILED
jgi:tellurite resistance protein